MSSVRDFRVLLFQLAEKLRDHDIEGIVGIEDLPAEFERQSALKILLKLEMMGRISAAKLPNLEEVLKNVNRIDLVKKVREFSKSQRKGRRNNTAATLEDKQRTLSANLEVTLVQMRIVLEQLNHLRQTALATGPKSVEVIVSDAQEDAKQLEKKLQYAKAHMKDDCSPDSSASETSASEPSFSPPVLPRHSNSFEQELEVHLANRKSPPRVVPKVAAATDPPIQTCTVDQVAPSGTAEAKKMFSQEESEAELYAEVVHPPCLIPKSAEESAYFETLPVSLRLAMGRDECSALVTGALQKPTERRNRKPAPPPKPLKFQKTSRKDTIAEAEEDDKDEGDYTDGTTGDSGFADARPFLKVDLEDSPQHTSTPTAPSYYKALRRKEVGDPSYYKVANREARTEMWQELLKMNEDSPKDERIYENYPSTSHTF